jgi:hypothetical protein
LHSKERKIKMETKDKRKELYDQISKLREANDNEKLVIFVGAGVSANSKSEDGENLPTWEGLIKKKLQR